MKSKALIIDKNAVKVPEDTSKTTPRRGEPNANSAISPTVTQFSQNPYLDLRTKPSAPPGHK